MVFKISRNAVVRAGLRARRDRAMINSGFSSSCAAFLTADRGTLT